MIEKFKDAFKEEAADLLNQLESTLLELEEHPEQMDLIQSVFRTMHTIKGSSAMFGFDVISKFTHEIESIMDDLREGKFLADHKFIDLTLQARDQIRLLLDASPSDVDDISTQNLVIIEDFKKHIRNILIPKEDEEIIIEAKAPKFEANSSSEESTQKTFRITFKPHKDLLINGSKPLKLLDELCNMGDCSITPHTESIPKLSDFNPIECFTSYEILLTTMKEENDIRDVFIFIEDKADIQIEILEHEESDAPLRKLGQILIDRGVAKSEVINAALQEQRKLGEVLVERNIATETQIQTALAEQEHLKKVRDKQQQDVVTSSIRVGSEKLDQLVDLVGELVTLQARLSRVSETLKDQELASLSEQSDRLISQLRDNTMSIRMMQIGSTFSKFRRVVRDLSSDLGKEAEFVTEGAETELDKTVIEKLNDPLVHIIRNSIDHGIESPLIREKAGKNKKGTIKLSAQHSGAHVLIEVSDDGAGLNKDAIYAKAVEKGIIPSGLDIPESELFNLIFAPGFSTAQKVTAVSGRGVGMDVVKREIDSLGGSVQLKSVQGKGTTFTLKIPLTLAIIDGLLVRVHNEFYVIPLSCVDGCIEVKEQELLNASRHIINFRNEILPYVSLRDNFLIPGKTPEIEQIVIVNAQESKIGIVVDTVIGDYQTVIKPLGSMYRSIDGLSGATILGDGTVALILDVNKLAMSAQYDELKALRA